MEKYQVAIVIPAFNEEATIFEVVQSAKDYGLVIVVNDASTDKTREMAADAGAIVVTHTTNKGYDKALNSGFKRAKDFDCDGVITFDADGQHSYKVLPIYIDFLSQGMELVLGVRPRKQRISETLFALYTKFAFGWSDPLCGMKGYSMSLYTKLGYFDSIGSIGTELAFFGIYNKFQFMEVNIPEIKRQDLPRFYSMYVANFKIIRSLIKLRWKYGRVNKAS